MHPLIPITILLAVAAGYSYSQAAKAAEPDRRDKRPDLTDMGWKPVEPAGEPPKKIVLVPGPDAATATAPTTPPTPTSAVVNTGDARPDLTQQGWAPSDKKPVVMDPQDVKLKEAQDKLVKRQAQADKRKATINKFWGGVKKATRGKKARAADPNREAAEASAGFEDVDPYGRVYLGGFWD